MMHAKRLVACLAILGATPIHAQNAINVVGTCTCALVTLLRFGVRA